MPAANLPKCACEDGHGQVSVGMVNFSVGMAKLGVGIGDVPTSKLTMPTENFTKMHFGGLSVGMDKFAVGRNIPIWRA